MNRMQRIQVNAQKAAIKTPDHARILIVDDQRFDRARLRRMCEALEFEVEISEADSLESMGTALELKVFDLIFLDYHMPEGSGLHAISAIEHDPRNRLAATIMVTGDGQSEIAIQAMKNGCSDFLVKDDLSNDSVRRAAINALQKASLNRSVETQEIMRNKVEAVLDKFTKECAEEIKPLLTKMLRHVRDLNSARANEDQYNSVVKQISNSCERLFDFMCDLEDHERKAFALSEVGIDPAEAEQAGRSQKSSVDRRKLFGRHPS